MARGVRFRFRVGMEYTTATSDGRFPLGQASRAAPTGHRMPRIIRAFRHGVGAAPDVAERVLELPSKIVHELQTMSHSLQRVIPL